MQLDYTVCVTCWSEVQLDIIWIGCVLDEENGLSHSNWCGNVEPPNLAGVVAGVGFHSQKISPEKKFYVKFFTQIT